MATPQTIKVTLQRDSLNTAWGFRLQGGADFRTPFIVNKILAGSPADGKLQRGDIILEINQTPINYMIHADALALIQKAGGEITFFIERGSHGIPQMPIPENQRSMSAVPWSYPSSSPPWKSQTHQLSPMAYFRNRPLERIPDPKPLLSQTGSPMMPGPVPSVSTKTRGYIQPPTFHSDRINPEDNIPSSPVRFVYPGPTYNNGNRTVHNAVAQQQSQDKLSWKEPFTGDSDRYIPAYQKRVLLSPGFVKQPYSPTLLNQAPNLVHRQFNSPMSLYSNENVQDVINHHISSANPLNQNEFTTDF